MIFIVRLPPIEDHLGTRSNPANSLSDQPQDIIQSSELPPDVHANSLDDFEQVPSQRGMRGRHHAPVVSKDYNLRNRNQITDDAHGGSTTLPGPGLVIPEDNPSWPLQAMRLVTGERWGDVVDFATSTHEVGNDISRNLLRSHCARHRPDWLIIVEPKITSASINHTFLRSLNLVIFSENHQTNHRPNIWVFCSLELAARSSDIGSTDQVIIVRTRHCQLDCSLDFVHAASDYRKRRELWEYVASLHFLNFCLIRDFNAILGSQERISARAPNPVSCADFREFIDLEQFFEIEAVGSPFTWATCRSSLNFIASKLNCVLAHVDFINHWDTVAVSILSRVASDHHPLLMVCDKGRPAGIWPLNFLNAWLLDSRFEQVVVQSWWEPFQTSDPLSVVMGKLRRLKKGLKQWIKEIFDDIDRKVAAAKDSLSTIQEEKSHQLAQGWGSQHGLLSQATQDP
ncbi:hypothetical protein ACS0TY_012540 [Phlomoides rotata]